MARGMNWEKVRRENMVRAHGWAEKRAEDAALRAARGITNPQAKLLADLKRQLGEPYSGSGLTCAEASRQIDDCFKRLGRKRAA
jgi:hypothetical protein